jgi:hypothetical protein
VVRGEPAVVLLVGHQHIVTVIQCVVHGQRRACGVA